VTLYDIYEGCRFPVDPLKSLYPVVARLMGVEPFLCDDYFLHLLPPWISFSPYRRILILMAADPAA
jgi:hypothetical protein